MAKTEKGHGNGVDGFDYHGYTQMGGSSGGQEVVDSLLIKQRKA